MLTDNHLSEKRKRIEKIQDEIAITKAKIHDIQLNMRFVNNLYILQEMNGILYGEIETEVLLMEILQHHCIKYSEVLLKMPHSDYINNELNFVISEMLDSKRKLSQNYAILQNSR